MADASNTQKSETAAATKTEQQPPRKFTSSDALDALTLYGKGVVSGLTLRNPIQLYKKNSEIRRLINKCVVCNGGILFGCIVLFNFIVLPMMGRCFPPKVVPGDVEGETREINSWPTAIVTFLYGYVILPMALIAAKTINAPSFSKICETFNSCRLNPLPTANQNNA